MLDLQVLFITTCVNKLCCTRTVIDSAFLLKNEPKCLQLVTISLRRKESLMGRKINF